jgi:hypothetical protein
MQEPDGWRLRVELNDPAGFHARLRDGRHLERELEPLISDHVVLSYDDDTVFAYAATRAAIDEAREGVDNQLQRDGLTATSVVSHWDDDLGDHGDWRQLEPQPDGSIRALEQVERDEHERHEARAARIETRTLAISLGKIVKDYFVTTVADEAREAGVELSIVEHPHLLTTQVAFSLTGPRGKIDTIIADLEAREHSITRMDLLMPITG